MAKELISKNISQQLEIIEGNGCVTIRAIDLKKHTSNSVTIFDELLIDVSSRLASVALKRRKLTPRALDGAKAAKK